MTIEDLARAAYDAGHHALGNAPGTDGGSDEWPLLSDLTRRFYRAMACAVIREVAADIGAAVDYMGSEPNHWATANHRLRALIAEARKETTR